MASATCEIVSPFSGARCDGPDATTWTAECRHGHVVTKLVCGRCAGNLNDGAIGCRACHNEGHACTMVPTAAPVPGT